MISDETRRKMSESAKKRVARGILPDNTGKSPWNKGLTADSHDSIAKYQKSQTGQKRQGNYISSDRWKGENNPWYGKNRSGSNHPSYNPDRRNRKFKSYLSKVRVLTERTYIKHMNEINPNNYPRTLSGVEGGYQLDHKISIIYGWNNSIQPEILASKDNLQMLEWKENRIKYGHVDAACLTELMAELEFK